MPLIPSLRLLVAPAFRQSDALPIGERVLGLLLDAFDLLGRELGSAVLMHPSWPSLCAVLLADPASDDQF